MGLYGFVYQSINAIMMSKENRVKKYGHDLSRVSVGTDNVVSATGVPTEVLSAAMGSLQFDGLVTSADKVIKFNAGEGVWPFSAGSNICAQLTGQESVNGYLPPEMDILVRLHRRKPFQALIQRSGITDAIMYNPAGTATAPTDHEKLVFDIKDLGIEYQALTTDQRTMDAMKAKTSWFVDVPKVSIDNVTSGKMTSRYVINVAPGTKFVAIAWIFTDHIFHREGSNKPMAPTFHFPPNAETVLISFEGELGLIFGRGFENLGTSTARNSMTSHQYHSRLVHLGLYSKPMNQMFPKHPTRSRDQILLFDLTAYKIKEHTKLYIDVKYDKNNGVVGFCMASVMVQQYQYTHRHGQELQCELVV